MRISRQVRQYWPLAIVTGAIAFGVPFIATQGDHRAGLAGITGRAAGLEVEGPAAGLLDNGIKPLAGFQRPAGMLPFYGFDGLSLQTPMFKSWWDGKAAVSKLKELSANTIVLDSSVWRDDRNFHDTVARLHGAGIKLAVEVTSVQDWVDLRDDGIGKAQPMPNTFVLGRASHVLAQARNQGVGRFADFIIVGGDTMAFATQLQRQKMYQLVKQYFPNTPVIRRYGSSLEKAEGLKSQPHPMGGTWDEYLFGPEECDVALVTLGRGVEDWHPGVRVSAALEQLNQIVSIVKSRHHDAAIVVSTQLGEDRLVGTSRAAMWSAREIDQFVSAILTSAAVDGLLFKGLGNYHFDFGHPDFGAQRVALKQAAPVPQQQSGSERAPASLERN